MTALDMDRHVTSDYQQQGPSPINLSDELLHIFPTTPRTVRAAPLAAGHRARPPVHKTVAAAVERTMGLEAAWSQAGHSSTEITRRYSVEPAVIVPDCSQALDEYSIRISHVGAADTTEARSAAVSDLA